MKYVNFNIELQKHSVNGFHKIEKADNIDSLKILGIADCEYLEFIQQIGTGSFFGGSFVLFSLCSVDKPYTILHETAKLKKLNFDRFVAIGYDGTTDGCYCIEKNEANSRIYWFNWEDCQYSVVHDSFFSWAENLPQELFDQKVFSGFKIIRDIDSIFNVIEARKKINIELLSFNKELVRPPLNQNDFLPRYNKLILNIFKGDNVIIDYVTIKLYRRGSPIKEKNVEFLTVCIKDIPENIATTIEAYLFDPFNLPFSDIVSLYTPNIDLQSKNRVRYKEIALFL